VNSVAFSPDGHTLASGNLDGTTRLWDVADPAHPSLLGQPLTSGGTAAVNSVAFSPDGHTLASGNLDGTIRLWSLPQTVLTGTGSASVSSVAFSPDGHTLASGSYDGVVRLWDVADPAHPSPLGQPRPVAAPSSRWRSAPMGMRWPEAASTARSGYGRSPIPRTPARSVWP
jgi:WD40 repeat protein